MPEHPLRETQLYVDWQCHGFPLPQVDQLELDVVDGLRFLAREVELPSGDDRRNDPEDD